MKTIKSSMRMLVPIVAVALISACGGGGDSGSTAALQTGGFVKSVGIAESPIFSDFRISNPKIRVQYMYTASEMKSAGNISAVSLRYGADTVSDITCSNVTIKMGHTTLSDLTTPLSSNVEQGAGSLETVMANSSVVFPAGTIGDRYAFKLDTPFQYNGVDNLVVDIDRNGTCDGDFPDSYTNTASVQAAWTYDDDLSSSTITRHPDMDFLFAGGVNKQDKGGTISDNYPFSDANGHEQLLYRSGDINGSGPISGFGLQLHGTSIEATYTMSVKMGHSVSGYLLSTYANNSNDLTAVATDLNVTIPSGLTAGDWIWVPLTGSFNYNGTDDLLIDIVTTANTGSANAVNSTEVIGLVRAIGPGDSDTALVVNAYTPNAEFRFNGAPMSVIEPNVVGYGTLLNTTTNGTQAIYGAYALGTGAAIKSIGLRVAGDVASDVTYTGANITMGHTTLSDLSSTLADNMDDAKVVFTGDITVPAGTKAGDWITLPVSGFTYNPTKNLTVQVLPGTSDTTTPLFFSGNGIISNTGSFAVGGTTITSFEGSRHPQLQLGLSK